VLDGALNDRIHLEVYSADDTAQASSYTEGLAFVVGAADSLRSCLVRARGPDASFSAVRHWHGACALAG